MFMCDQNEFAHAISRVPLNNPLRWPKFGRHTWNKPVFSVIRHICVRFFSVELSLRLTFRLIIMRLSAVHLAVSWYLNHFIGCNENQVARMTSNRVHQMFYVRSFCTSESEWTIAHGTRCKSKKNNTMKTNLQTDYAMQIVRLMRLKFMIECDLFSAISCYVRTKMMKKIFFCQLDFYATRCFFVSSSRIHSISRFQHECYAAQISTFADCVAAYKRTIATSERTGIYK